MNRFICFSISFLMIAMFSGCIGPSIFANRSHVEYYNATMEGKNSNKRENSPTSVDGAKDYDLSSSVSAGSGTGSAVSENNASDSTKKSGTMKATKTTEEAKTEEKQSE